jgi:threonine dehydratase
VAETNDTDVPTVAQMRAAAEKLAPHIVVTPSVPWHGPHALQRLGAQARLFLKLELFQRTGTFKFRAAMLNAFALNDEQRRRGVTAVSAGNHAIAVACAAQHLDMSAKVVMLQSANPMRIAAAKAYGAEILMAEDGRSGFALVDEIRAREGRIFIHPFDGRNVVLGTSSVALELLEQVPELEAIVVAVGGGGLMSGIAAAVKQIKPDCLVLGVEPAGADVMSRSLRASAPQRMERVDTIADSLAPPMTTQSTYELCRAFVDEMVTVSDDEICAALALLYRDAKLAVEPAGAAAAAAVLGPLASRLRGRRTGVIVCGANIDSESFYRYLRRGEEELKRLP